MHHILQSMILNQGLETKSVVKDYYIRSALLILEMGAKSCISKHAPVPIIFQQEFGDAYLFKAFCFNNTKFCTISVLWIPMKICQRAAKF